MDPYILAQNRYAAYDWIHENAVFDINLTRIPTAAEESRIQRYSGNVFSKSFKVIDVMPIESSHTTSY